MAELKLSAKPRQLGTEEFSNPGTGLVGFVLVALTANYRCAHGLIKNGRIHNCDTLVRLIVAPPDSDDTDAAPHASHNGWYGKFARALIGDRMPLTLNYGLRSMGTPVHFVLPASLFVFVGDSFGRVTASSPRFL